MIVTDEQKIEVMKFQTSLNHEDEWLFYHMAWVEGDTEVITFEDKYAVMKRWDKIIKYYTNEEKEDDSHNKPSGIR